MQTHSSSPPPSRTTAVFLCSIMQAWLLRLTQHAPLVAETLLKACIGNLLQLAWCRLLENKGISLLSVSLCTCTFPFPILRLVDFGH